MADCADSGGNTTTQRNALLLYILNNAATKFPMKQSEMAEILGKQSSKKLQEMMPGIVKALKNVYGIILMEVPNQKSGKKFICFAEDSIRSIEELQDNQKREITLLFIILSYIFLMGGTVFEEQVQQFLEGLQITYNEEHAYFGPNIKKLITENFLKQLYLKREKSDSELSIETRYTLSWGFRAQMEFKKKQVLEISASLMGHSPEFFQTQYIEACAQEEGAEDESGEDESDEDEDDEEDATILD